MPSQLRLQSSFEEPISANAIHQRSPTLPPPAKKQKKMSLTQTYYVASTARSKLGKEAGRADHDLRLLVGHANLLDSLMYSLQEAEREQEAWFNESVRKASKPEEPRHVQWVDSLATLEEDDEDSDSESDDGSDVDEMEMFDMMPLRKIKSPPVEISSSELYDEDMDMESALYDDEDDDAHALTRVASQHSPPELTHDADDSDSDDEMPPSPENIVLELSQKERQAITTTAFYDIKPQQALEDYVSQQPLIAAC